MRRGQAVYGSLKVMQNVVTEPELAAHPDCVSDGHLMISALLNTPLREIAAH